MRYHQSYKRRGKTLLESLRGGQLEQDSLEHKIWVRALERCKALSLLYWDIGFAGVDVLLDGSPQGLSPRKGEPPMWESFGVAVVCGLEKGRLLWIYSVGSVEGNQTKKGSVQLLEECKWRQNTAKKQMGSDGVSDHRKAVAMYLEGKKSSLSSSAPSFNGDL